MKKASVFLLFIGMTFLSATAQNKIPELANIQNRIRTASQTASSEKQGEMKKIISELNNAKASSNEHYIVYWQA